MCRVTETSQTDPVGSALDRIRQKVGKYLPRDNPGLDDDEQKLVRQRARILVNNSAKRSARQVRECLL